MHTGGVETGPLQANFQKVSKKIKPNNSCFIVCLESQQHSFYLIICKLLLFLEKNLRNWECLFIMQNCLKWNFQTDIASKLYLKKIWKLGFGYVIVLKNIFQMNQK
jgi:hypothetical protein